MGAGIAKSIARQFPEALAADKFTSFGKPDKLGSYSSAQVERNGNTLTIVNAYTQFNWRGRGRKVDYDAARLSFEKIAADFSDMRIGYPMIGAGLAGGDWSEISGIINTVFQGMDHTLVIFKPT